MEGLGSIRVFEIDVYLNFESVRMRLGTGYFLVRDFYGFFLGFGSSN